MPFMNPNILVLVLSILLFRSGLAAQESDLDLSKFNPDHFTFVRIVYDSIGGNGEAYYRGDAGIRQAG